MMNQRMGESVGEGEGEGLTASIQPAMAYQDKLVSNLGLCTDHQGETRDSLVPYH